MDLTTLFCPLDDLVQARNNQSIWLEQSKPPERRFSANLPLRANDYYYCIPSFG